LFTEVIYKNSTTMLQFTWNYKNRNANAHKNLFHWIQN